MGRHLGEAERFGAGGSLARGGVRHILGDSMRTFFVMLCCLCSVAAAHAGGHDVLATAVSRFAQEAKEWAFTQKTVSRDSSGKLRREVVMRYDPSRPEEEQFTPLLINGRAPSEWQIARYRRSQEKHRQETDPQALSQLLDVDAARQVGEEGETLLFEVPLRRAENETIDPEKFNVVVRVNKHEPALEEMWVKLREPVRTRAILQLEEGEANLRFKSATADTAPTLTELHATGRGSIAFIKVGGSYELSRSDFVHVKR